MEGRLEISAIFNFVKSSHSSNNVREAEAILKAKRLISCGVKRRENEEIEVEALCLQSSTCNSPPHTVTGVIFKKNGDWEIKRFFCTCKAGASQTCKHCVATMLFCHESKMIGLEDLSVTDIACSWNKNRKQLSSHSTPIPIQDYCHFKGAPVQPFCEEKRKRMREEMIKLFPDSALATHYRRAESVKNRPSKKPTLDMNVDEEANEITDLAVGLADIFRRNLNPHFDVAKFVTDEINFFYSTNICVTSNQAIEIAKMTISQDDQLWKTERNKRIIGSKCYELYTYSKNRNPNWPRKVEKMLNPNFAGNFSTSYGLQHEDVARNEYSKVFGMNVSKCGLIIHPMMPFLGYSPDGIIFGNEIILIEIKCPILGMKKCALEIVDKLEFLFVDATSKYVLKQKHKYYGQVQLGMYLTSAVVCDLVIFSSFDNSFVKVIVPRDENFISNMLPTLCETYFNCILPAIMK